MAGFRATLKSRTSQPGAMKARAHYDALYYTQDSAAQRNVHRNAVIFAVHRMGSKGWSVERIARKEKLTQASVRNYLSVPEPESRLLFPHELRRLAEEQVQQGNPPPSLAPGESDFVVRHRCAICHA